MVISVLVIGGDELFKIFDNFMDGLFMVLYFPNFITLFVVILLNAIFAFVSLFSSDMHKVNKGINYVFFGIVQSLFILVILAIRSNDLNIYKDNALYSNNDVLSLMQILIGAFGIQMVSLLIINLINRVTSVLDKKESKLSNSINEQIDDLKKSKKDNNSNNEVGFINVADKTRSSKPILKPFKFDIEKLQSIKLDVESKPKVLSPIKLKNNSVSYLNEVVKPRLFKPIVLDSSKFIELEVPEKTIKSITLDSNDVSYLNEVIKPRKLKPFKLNTMKTIHLNVPLKKAKQLFKNITLNNSNFSYLNEIIKGYKMKDIDLEKDINLEVLSKPYNEVVLDNKDFTYLNGIFNNLDTNVELPKKVYKKVHLKNSDFSYVNEIFKEEKYKLFKIDSSRFVNLNVNSILKSKKLSDKDFSYKNEVIRKFKPISLDKEKANNTKLDVEVKPKKYNFLSLKDKAIGYLNEVFKVRKFKPVKLDSEKIKSTIINGPVEDSEKKLYNVFSLDNNKDIHLEVPFDKEIIKDNGIKQDSKFVSGLVKGTNPDNDFDKLFTSKPDLMRPMEEKYQEPIVASVEISKPVETISIDNLRIIDIQSTLDVVSKYHLYKDVKLTGVNDKDSVENLSIPNFELLIGTLNNYKLVK
ncbi:MAG: hypothetical protein IKJ43_00290 [Bacilli bacterium]|nr:hypothetical protein [Bacilli bacterium]